MSIFKRLFGSKDPSEKAENLYQKGLKLTRQHHYKDAVPILEEAAKLNQTSAAIHAVLASSYSQIAGEYEGDEQAMNLWMNKATDTFRKAITLHRQHGGLNHTQLTTAMDLVTAVDRINMDKSQSPPKNTRRKIFKEFTTLKEAKNDWQSGAWDAIMRGTDIADMTSRIEKPKADAEEKAMCEVARKYSTTEWQLRAIIQEGENKKW